MTSEVRFKLTSGTFELNNNQCSLSVIKPFCPISGLIKNVSWLSQLVVTIGFICCVHIGKSLHERYGSVTASWGREPLGIASDTFRSDFGSDSKSFSLDQQNKRWACDPNDFFTKLSQLFLSYSNCGEIIL